jgi:hypothetical protein
MTGRVWFQLTILVLGLIICAAIASVIKLRTGQSWKMIVTDKRLQQSCFGLALVVLVGIFALFIYINN